MKQTKYAVNAVVIFKKIFGIHQDIACTETVLKHQDGDYRNFK
jgi:hypothetical protein